MSSFRVDIYDERRWILSWTVRGLEDKVTLTEISNADVTDRRIV